MAKDPAFLFYSSDFLTGTSFMSEAETGQYIRILCHMHQSGHLSIEDMKIICPNISFKVLAKFRTDDKGLYYNERLETEVERRKNYSESRRNNRLKNKKETHDITYVPAVSGHMETENENRTINGIKEGVQGKPLPETLSDGWFESIFDELTLENYAMSFRDKDVHDQYDKFKLKVRGDPASYEHRDTGGMRNAFQHHLEHAKRKTEQNGHGRGTNGTTSAQIAGTRYTGSKL